MQPIKLLLLFAFYLIFISQSFGQTAIYFSTAGSGTKSGATWTNAAQGTTANLQTAIQAGKLVYLKAGTYSITASLLANSTTSYYIKGSYPSSATGIDTTGYNPNINLTTFDGGSSVQILGTYTNTSMTLAVYGVIFQNGKSTTGGGILDFYGPSSGTGKLTFQDCSFLNNTNTSTTAHFGGAISIYGDAANNNQGTNLINCYFSGNTTPGTGSSGGGAAIGIQQWFGTTNITNSAFSSNNTSQNTGGGALYLANLGSSSLSASFNITNTNFCSNSATVTTAGVDPGGAIFFSSTSPYNTSLNLSYCNFVNNLAYAQGGGVYLVGGQGIKTSTWDHVIFYGNQKAYNHAGNPYPASTADVYDGQSNVAGPSYSALSITNTGFQTTPNTTDYPYVTLGTGNYLNSTDPLASCPSGINTAVVAISGTVWDDANNNLSIDGSEAGTNTGNTLYVNLVDLTTSKVYASVAVASNGTYSGLTEPLGGDNYALVLTTSATSTTPTLPTGWINTGQNIGSNTATQSGTKGIITLPTSFSSSTLSGQNFGIVPTPTAGSGSNTATNPGANTQTLVPANTFTNTTASSEPSPGAIADITITSFPANAASIVINGTIYTNSTWPSAGITVPSDASGNPTQTITIAPTTSGATTITISFVAIDNNNQQSSNTGSAVLSLTSPCGSNTVSDGNLSSTLASWTNSSGGWNVNSTNGYAYDVTNGTGTNQALSQTISNIAVQSGTITLTFNYAQSPCTGCTTAEQKGDLYVQFGGTQYLTLSAPAGSSTVAATAQNGASVSPSSFALRTGTQPLTAITLTIPTSGVNSTSGLLSFIHGISNGEYNDNLLSTVSLAPACADLSVSKTGPASVNAGAALSYSLLVSNNGSNSASGATVNDPSVSNFTATGVTCAGATGGAVCPTSPTLAALQAGTLSIPTFPSGSSLTFTVSGTAGAGGSITNVATVSTPPGVSDAITSNNTSTAITQIINTVTGNVYDDVNGLSDNTVNGTGTNAGSKLNAILYDNTLGEVTGVTAVVSAGTYSFSNATSGDVFTVYITTSTATAGQTATPTVSLPSGWVNTGEHLGSGAGSDGTPNGILSLGTVNDNTSNANFGIVDCPNGLSITPTASPGVVCSSSPTVVALNSSASGGITPYASYAWAGSGLTANNTQNTTANPAASGTYTVTVTDAVGCTASGTTTAVTYDGTQPSISVTCTGSSVQLYESNGVTWYWTTTSGGRFYPDNTYSASNDSSTSHLQGPFIKFMGSYSVQITDANGCTSMGGTTVGSCSTLLADNFVSLTGQRQSSLVQLHWRVASEAAVANYVIERSKDGSNFEVAGTVAALNTSNAIYSFSDDVSSIGCITLYYRVKQVTSDGNGNNSNTITVNCNNNDAGQYVLKAYPNPVFNGNELNISYTLPPDIGKAELVITNMIGNTCLKTALSNNTTGTVNTANINLNSSMATGTYILRIVSDKWISKTIKIIKAN